MMKRILLGLCLSFATFCYADVPYGYVGSHGVIVKSGFGLCWHTGYWTPSDAVEDCDFVKKAKVKYIVPEPPKAPVYVAPVVVEPEKPVVKEVPVIIKPRKKDRN